MQAKELYQIIQTNFSAIEAAINIELIETSSDDYYKIYWRFLNYEVIFDKQKNTYSTFVDYGWQQGGLYTTCSPDSVFSCLDGIELVI